MEPFQLVSHSTPGRLIAVEGMNGCGVTTMTRKIGRELMSDGYDVLSTRLPSDRFRKSSMFQAYVRQNDRSVINPMAFEVAYMADRLHTIYSDILPALEQGKIVVTDRYLFSSLGVLLARAPELAAVVKDALYSRPWFRDLVQSMVKPDISIHLTVDVGVAVDRMLRRENQRVFDLELNTYQQLMDEFSDLAKLQGMKSFDTTTDNPAKTYEKMRPHLAEVLTW
jgi:dTMP kinase